MDIYTIPTDLPEHQLSDDDIPDAVTEHLKGAGFAVDGVSVQIRPEPAFLIVADQDPTDAIAAYTPQPTKAEIARTALHAAIQDIRDKTPGTRSPAERAVLALVALQRLD